MVLVDSPDILAATDLHIIRDTSFWYVLVIAAAKRSGCRVLYSEDLQTGRSFDGLEIVNPIV